MNTNTPSYVKDSLKNISTLLNEKWKNENKNRKIFTNITAIDGKFLKLQTSLHNLFDTKKGLCGSIAQLIGLLWGRTCFFWNSPLEMIKSMDSLIKKGDFEKWSGTKLGPYLKKIGTDHAKTNVFKTNDLMKMFADYNEKRSLRIRPLLNKVIRTELENMYTMRNNSIVINYMVYWIVDKILQSSLSKPPLQTTQVMPLQLQVGPLTPFKPPLQTERRRYEPPPLNPLQPKKIRKHKGILQNGGNAGRLRKGYKYSGKRLKSGKAEIIKVKNKLKIKTSP
jgi:hypothetical protein